jgi:phosphate butyryltransferase
MNKNFFLFCLISYLVLTTSNNSLSFDQVIEKAKKIGKMKKIAVAGGDNLTMLQACRKAKDMKIADCILFGISKKIKDKAASNNLDISDFEIIEEPNDSQCALSAAEYVREGKADIYAKGSLETKYSLNAVFDSKRGLRHIHIISALSILEAPKINRILIFTDCHVRPYPSMVEKISSINNAVEVAKSFGIEMPKVAAVSGVEKVNPKMKETGEAHLLSKLHDDGEIKGCIVDGPLSFDLAVNSKVPKYKGMEKRKIKGDADVILFSNIHTANIAYNLMVHLIKAKSATIIAGTIAPVVFNSRDDTAEAKFHSIVFSVLYSEELMKEGKK